MSGITIDTSVNNDGKTPSIITVTNGVLPSVHILNRWVLDVLNKVLYYDNGTAFIAVSSVANTSGFVPYTGANHYLDMGLHEVFANSLQAINSPTSGSTPGGFVLIGSNNDPVNGAGALIQSGQTGSVHPIHEWELADTTFIAALYPSGELKTIGFFHADSNISGAVLRLVNADITGIVSGIDLQAGRDDGIVIRVANASNSEKLTIDAKGFLFSKNIDRWVAGARLTGLTAAQDICTYSETIGGVTDYRIDVWVDPTVVVVSGGTSNVVVTYYDENFNFRTYTLEYYVPGGTAINRSLDNIPATGPRSFFPITIPAVPLNPITVTVTGVITSGTFNISARITKLAQ